MLLGSMTTKGVCCCCCCRSSSSAPKCNMRNKSARARWPLLPYIHNNISAQTNRHGQFHWHSAFAILLTYVYTIPHCRAPPPHTHTLDYHCTRHKNVIIFFFAVLDFFFPSTAATAAVHTLHLLFFPPMG